MANSIDLATSLFGNKRLENGESTSVNLITGTAVSDSKDGKVSVVIDGTVVADDYDSELENNVIELDTNPTVSEGDVVQITEYGGTSKSMVVTGVVGDGDKITSRISDTKSGLESQITQTAEGLTVKINTAQDTADTATTNAATAQSTANTAKTNAATAQSTADAAKTAAANAQTSADDARKVATNYLSFDSTDGLVVGDMTTTLGNNTQITSNGVNIRNGSTVLASFEDDEIALGKNSFDSQVSFCGGAGTISATTDGSLAIYAYDVTGSEEFGTSIRLVPQDLIQDNAVEGAEVEVAPYKGISLEKNKFINPYYYTGKIEISDNSIEAEVNKTKTKSSVTTVEYVNGFMLNEKGFYVCNGSSSPRNYGLVYGETVLFNNTSQSFDASVTLSSSCTGYTYLDVFAMDNNSQYIHQRVYNPVVGRRFSIMSMWHDSTGTYIKTKSFTIQSATKIETSSPSSSVYSTGEYNLSSFTQGDVIKIIRVVGIK